MADADDGCDNCGRKPVQEIVAGISAEGRSWHFALCEQCAAALPSPEGYPEGAVDEHFGHMTREEFMELLRRSK